MTDTGTRDFRSSTYLLPTTLRHQRWHNLNESQRAEKEKDVGLAVLLHHFLLEVGLRQADWLPGYPMPTCLECAKCWPMLTGALCAVNSQRSMSQWIAFQRSSTQIQLLGGRPFYRNHTGSVRRALETLATVSKSPIMRIPSHQQTLTLLHKTMAFLDHALDDSLITKGNSEKLSFWRGVALRAICWTVRGWDSEFQSSCSQWVVSAKLLRQFWLFSPVVGVDEWSGARGLVTLLLTDPLASTGSQEQRLQDRWKDQPKELEALTIEWVQVKPKYHSIGWLSRELLIL